MALSGSAYGQIPGAPGSVIRSGSGAPSAGLGSDGDWYLDISNGDLHWKQSGSYGVELNIKGPQGSSGQASLSVCLLAANGAATAAATNLAADTFNAIGDPAYRWMGDLRGKTAVRIMGRIGGALVAATSIRIQYHTGGNPAVASGDAGWTTLATSAGSHSLNTTFYSAEISVPQGAQINNCLIRAGLFSGNGTADPTMTMCILNFYTP